MIRRPRLRASLTILPVAGGGWTLEGGSGEAPAIELADARSRGVFASLLPYLDGGLDAETIVDRLEGAGVDRADSSALLGRLEDAGCLEEGGDAGLAPGVLERHAEQVAYFGQFRREGGAAFQARLLAGSVAVIGDGPLSRVLRSQLEESGIGELIVVTAEAENTAHEGTAGGVRREVLPLDRARLWPADRELPDLLVVPQEAHDPELLEALDDVCRRRGQPWMLVRTLSVEEGWVGPLFLPPQTASYVSLEARLRGNLAYYDEYQAFDRHVRESGRPAASGGALLPTLEVLGGIAVAEIVAFLSGHRPPALAGRFLTVDLMTWQTEVHHVLRVPMLDEIDSPLPITPPWRTKPDEPVGRDPRHA